MIKQKLENSVFDKVLDSLRFPTPIGNVIANRRNLVKIDSGVMMKHKRFLLNSHCIYVAFEHNV